MTTWAHGVSGNFNTGSNWNGGTVPSSGQDADLSPTGTYTVTVNIANAVNTVLGVQTSANARSTSPRGPSSRSTGPTSAPTTAPL